MNKKRSIVFISLLFPPLLFSQFQRDLTPYSLETGQVSEIIRTSDDLKGQEKEKKSVLLAVGLSLLLPGSGEWYAGRPDLGRFFLASEIGFILGYSSFQSIGGTIKNDARTFARVHSGADFNDKDDKYEVNVGNFGNSILYNEQKFRNREYSLVYPSSSLYEWQWDNDANRIRFRDERIRGDEYLLNSNYFLALMAVNRIISAFVAGQSVAQHNRIQTAESFSIKIAPSVHGISAVQITEVRLSVEF